MRSAMSETEDVPPRIPPLREFLCSDSTTRDLLREARELVIAHRARESEADAARMRRGLRRHGYRVRFADTAGRGLDELEGTIDMLIVLPGVDVVAVARAARRRGARTLWLALSAGDPHEAYAAHREGLLVVFHRDPVREYAMHFDDAELLGPGVRPPA
jgi:predicted CoA-binding protein